MFGSGYSEGIPRLDAFELMTLLSGKVLARLFAPEGCKELIQEITTEHTPMEICEGFKDLITSRMSLPGTITITSPINCQVYIEF